MSQAQAKTEDRRAARRALANFNSPAFEQTVGRALRRRSAATLQVNIGLTCNLACRHCHVESSSARLESMPRRVADRLLELTAKAPYIKTVDITGGAPEMHEEFRYLVSAFSEQGLHLMDRCNLVVLEEPGQEGTAEFLREHNVHIVASLPCYSAENVTAQRGDGVFDASIRVLQRLNALGYGGPNGPRLDLVYNPVSPVLPPEQGKLEADYRRELRKTFGIEFSNLFCIANMPIKRYADDLIRSGRMQEYLDLLVQNFSHTNVDNVMCLDMIHVAWDGSLHDCDFNYALAMPSAVRFKAGNPTSPTPPTIFDIESWDDLLDMRIRTDTHCYGCTAGSGSSCGGSLA